MFATPQRTGADAPWTLEVERPRRPRWRTLAAAALLAAAATAVGWHRGALHTWLRAGRPTTLPLVAVDRGLMQAVVTEAGSLESADNAAVKCEVEALVSLTGGRRGVIVPPAPRNVAPGVGAAPMISSRAASAIRAGATGKVGIVPLSGVAPTPAPSPAGQGGGAAPIQTSLPRPTLRSFGYSVPSYAPVRARMSPAVAQRMGIVDPSLMMGGRGAGLFVEKPGSTRVLRLVDEGTHVRAGDVVCELDSANFQVELKTQQVRAIQAKSWVDQARTNLDVALLSLKEYREAIHPQDTQLVRQYLQSCRVEAERARKNLAWSEDSAARGYRSPNQVRADALALEQAEFRVADAEHMAARLEKYTAPKITTKLKARVEAVRSDLLAQEAAYQLELDRLKRLETAVARCTLRAPRDGVVVYHRTTTWSGTVNARLQEGVTVREGQTLIDLPDPKTMRVRARVNESTVAMVHRGQPARVVVDAFPNRALRATVAELTPLPSAAAGPLSDVKQYEAILDLHSQGFEGLLPGLSAVVTFLVGESTQVTRVPLEAVRWVEDRAYAAVAEPPTEGEETRWRWHEVELGRTDRDHAEVIAGLNAGDRVVARPEDLPAPRPARRRTSAAESGPLASAR